eukprot:Skav203604  [mRNA]  locus=scaffold935:337135:338752:+ [translate_table: standard]
MRRHVLRNVLLLTALWVEPRLFCGPRGRLPRPSLGRSGVTLQRWAVPDFNQLADAEDVFEIAASITIVLAGALYTWKSLWLGDSMRERQVKRVVREFLQPFRPAAAEQMVVEREARNLTKTCCGGELLRVVKRFQQHLVDWKGHATVISGRRGSGKTWIWQQALRNVPGVAMVSVSAQPVEKAIKAAFGLDLGALQEVLKQVRLELDTSNAWLETPVIVLEVQHATRDVVEGIHSLAKALSSDARLAHVVVCDSTLVAPLFMSWGQECSHFWADDLSLAEAREFLLARTGCEDWQRSWAEPPPWPRVDETPVFSPLY